MLINFLLKFAIKWDPDVPTNGAITWISALNWYGAKNFRRAKK